MTSSFFQSKMKYVTSFIFAALICFLVYTEVAQCAPEAGPEADPFFFGGFGRGRGREGGGYRHGGYGGYGRGGFWG